MIARLSSRFDAWLWRAREDHTPLLKRYAIQLLQLFTVILRDVRFGTLPLYAASLVYTTLLSLAPLLAICFSVLKGIGAHNQIEPFLKEVLSPLGSKSADISERVISFVDKIQVGVLGAVGVAILLYSVIALMRKIEHAFNDIWHVRKPRGWAQHIRDYLSILLIGPLLLFLSVGMTTSLQHAQVIDAWLGVHFFSAAAESFFAFVPFALFVIVFSLLYMVMPNTRVRFVPAFAAGLLTALLWKGLGAAFGLFVTESASYAAIYSAFATLILLIIWLYVGWMVVLVGASVSYYLQNPSNMTAAQIHLDDLHAARDYWAVRFLCALLPSFYHDQTGLSIGQIAARLHVPRLFLETLAEDLESSQLVTAEGRFDPVYIPRFAAEQMTVAQVLEKIRQRPARAYEAVDHLFDAADKARDSVFAKTTLKDLAFSTGQNT